MSKTKGRVLVAMSGGVDSSVAAYLLTQAGYECIGVTMRLFDNSDAGIPVGSTCCSLDDVEDAKEASRRLGIKHYVFNFTDDFKRDVIGRFADAYMRGETPNPCIDCNRHLKFGRLYERAKQLGCDFIATGHYARICRDENGRYLLKKAVDETKDQSYVLYSMTQDELAHTLFPLGELTKKQVREIAAKIGFSNAKKQESQDICFAPDGNYAAAIERYTGKTFPPGRFISKDGKYLGENKGIIHYTIGQRRGLGTSASGRIYVLEKRAATNEVVLGDESELYAGALLARDFNWISREEPEKGEKIRVSVRTRYRQRETGAYVYVAGSSDEYKGSMGDNNSGNKDNKAAVRVEFDEPVRAVAPGQSAVLYDGDVVVGGGIIDKAIY
ncbi:MAG: tRNA 2-thiouridine(34) synthase MnmA [Eubacteriales bacterium]|jgi:tRNA-specific 2-thiouridylase